MRQQNSFSARAWPLMSRSSLARSALSGKPFQPVAAARKANAENGLPASMSCLARSEAPFAKLEPQAMPSWPERCKLHAALHASQCGSRTPNRGPYFTIEAKPEALNVGCKRRAHLFATRPAGGQSKTRNKGKRGKLHAYISVPEQRTSLDSQRHAGSRVGP